MQIEINGSSVDTVATTLDQILSEYVRKGAPFAVALNQVFIPKSQYQSTRVCEFDKIEVVSPMQGG